MKMTDVVIVGDGRAGRFIAEKMQNRRKSAAIIALPSQSEDYLRNLVLALADSPEEPQEKPEGPNPHFLDDRTIEIGDEQFQAKYFVIASGCGPKRSTNGSTHILENEEPEMVEAVTDALEDPEAAIVAAGLQPATAGLELGKAGVLLGASGEIVINEEMRTSNPRIFAVGPVTGPKFNLEYEMLQADIAAHNIDTSYFFRRRMEPDAVPEVLPFNPPFAHVGMTEKQARDKYRNVIAATYSENGTLIKLVGRKRDAELLGAHIFGAGADGLVLFFDLLLRAKISLRDVADGAHYPGPGPADLALAGVSAWLTALNS